MNPPDDFWQWTEDFCQWTERVLASLRVTVPEMLDTETVEIDGGRRRASTVDDVTIADWQAD